ncbi:MAG: WD40/YVTN/BNR-like repeat-containing protein, partial [Candidatus Kariarchaeaceae archaeon]
MANKTFPDFPPKTAQELNGDHEIVGINDTYTNEFRTKLSELSNFIKGQIEPQYTGAPPGTNEIQRIEPNEPSYSDSVGSSVLGPWTQQTAGLPESSSFANVAHDGTQFVAVGAFGKIIASTDAVTWTQRITGFEGPLESNRDIIYAQSKFVVVGLGGRILTSADASSFSWTAQTSNTPNKLNAIEYDGSQFVAVGDNGTIVTSPNAITWTVQSSPTLTTLWDIVWNGSQFVAVGAYGTIITSANGISWTQQTSGLEGEPFLDSYIRGIAWDATHGYVACL